ncbi:MAG: porin, partial [Burkholderiaceae bacterium]|nr:porin [Burkholderiaceae bacterium]
MFKTSMLAAALSAAVAAPSSYAADQKPRSTPREAASLTALRAEITQMKQAYEQRLQALELRLQQAETAAQARVDAQATAGNATLAAAVPSASAPAQPAERADPAMAGPSAAPVGTTNLPAIAAVAPAANLYNPAISMILGGTLQNLRQDPQQYALQGFMPSGGEVGPGKRGFNLGESELTFAANIDPQFAGQLTLAFSPENEAAVEEAYIRTRALEHGLNLKAGRMLSGIGYMNGQHAHTWDFVDAPLAYQAMLGGQYKTDGVQATWLAPLDQYLEVGVEAGNGAAFPGNERNRNGAGAVAVFAHLGDDLGASTSYRAGLSYLRSAAQQRSFADAGLEHSFSGRSALWIADAIVKWAPNGNATQTNLKLQGEYFRRSEHGSLDVASASAEPLASSYNSVQSGWYLQSVYQFMPNWRTGLRYDRLN